MVFSTAASLPGLGFSWQVDFSLAIQGSESLLGYDIPDLILGRSIGRSADRFGRRYVVPAGFLWAAACSVLLALSLSRWQVGLIIAALSLGFDATHPLMSSITTSLDHTHRGRVTGMTGFAKFIGMAIGALAFRRCLFLGFPHAFLIFAGIHAAVGVLSAVCLEQEVPPAGTAAVPAATNEPGTVAAEFLAMPHAADPVSFCR